MRLTGFNRIRKTNYSHVGKWTWAVHVMSFRLTPEATRYWCTPELAEELEILGEE